MKLRKWREINGLTLDAAAARIGVGNGTVICRYELGQMFPRPPTLRAIFVATKGEVQPNDFVDLPDIKQMRAA